MITTILVALDGSTRATLIAAGDLLADANPSGAVSASERGGEFMLSGNGGLTLDGASAELLIVVAALEDGGAGLFALEPSTSGVMRNPAATIDETRKTAVVEFDGAAARRLDSGIETDAAIARVLDRGAVSLAAEMVGGAQQAIDTTVAYLNEREQFGGPIGRFQALKHRLADLAVAIDAAREGVYSAADAIDDLTESDHDLGRPKPTLFERHELDEPHHDIFFARKPRKALDLVVIEAAQQHAVDLDRPQPGALCGA